MMVYALARSVLAAKTICMRDAKLVRRLSEKDLELRKVRANTYRDPENPIKVARQQSQFTTVFILLTRSKGPGWQLWLPRLDFFGSNLEIALSLFQNGLVDIETVGPFVDLVDKVVLVLFE